VRAVAGQRGDLARRAGEAGDDQEILVPAEQRRHRLGAVEDEIRRHRPGHAASILCRHR
jgi:hypothetical protein